MRKRMVLFCNPGTQINYYWFCTRWRPRWRLKILPNFWKSKNQQNLFLIKAFFRGLNFYFWKSHMLLEKLFLTLSGNKKMHFKMPLLLLTINFHLGLMHWLTNVRKVIYFLKLTSHKNKTNGLCLPIELKDICSVEKSTFFLNQEHK